MRPLDTRLLLATSMILLGAASAFADKATELYEQQIKPWTIGDLPGFDATLADVPETEPNNTCGTAEPYTMGDVVHATLTAGDQDWFAFSAGAGDVLTLGTDTDGGVNPDTYLELYADNCTTVLAFNDDGGPGLFSLISNYMAPYTGTYYLKCRGFSSSTTGAYRMIGTVVAAPATTCPLDNYKGIKYDVNIPIPDNDPTGITVGPVYFYDDGSVILDVIADLGLSHTFAGDLVVTLTHVVPNGPTTSVKLIDRPGLPPGTFGCGGDLVGSQTDKYYFGTDPDLEVLGESSCPTTIPTQCYQVAPENPNGLTAFRGQPKAGEWWLTVSDNAGADLGTLWDFSVHLLNQAPVSLEPASWGSVKSQYR